MVLRHAAHPNLHPLQAAWGGASQAISPRVQVPRPWQAKARTCSPRP